MKKIWNPKLLLADFIKSIVCRKVDEKKQTNLRDNYPNFNVIGSSFQMNFKRENEKRNLFNLNLKFNYC